MKTMWRKHRAVFGLTVVAAACSPALNWRDVRFEDAPLAALLPCKPDRGTRSLPVGGQTTLLSMQGCEAGGQLFTLAHAELAESVDVSVALRDWKRAILANAGTTDSRDVRFVPPGATPFEGSVLARFDGKTGSGPVAGQSAFFAWGRHVFQAAIFSEQADATAAETFFSSLRID